MAYPKFYQACRENNYALAVELIEKGNVDVHWFNESCLRVSCLFGFEKIVELLIANGADVSVKENTCLEQAISQGYLNVVKKLVKGGANIHLSNEKALRYAVYLGHLKIVQYLVEEGADVNAFETDPLIQAYTSKSFRIARYLITRGANPNAQRGKCISILAKDGFLKEVKFLFCFGGDIKLASEAVRIASLKGFTGFARYLVSLGADKKGLTPIHKELFEREELQRRHEAAKKIYYWIIPKLYAPGSESAYRLGLKGYEASMQGKLM